MSSHPQYQLTAHPSGSRREVWSLSWPLMLSFCSNSFMFFADRLFLAHYNIAAMNAMALAANFCFLGMIFPFALCEITEVFVGRFHGEGRDKSVGRPTWQIIWFILALWPLFMIGSRLSSSLFFTPGSLEETYFVTFLDFGPCLLLSLALMGFFIGTGRTSVITYATVLGNILNMILCPLLIFYTSLGIKGAAIATGTSQGCQALILLWLFFRKENRQRYATHDYKPDFGLLKEMLRVGFPAGISRIIEVTAHCVFFSVMAMAGPLELTCATLTQGFFLLIVFCNDGLSKGVTAIISNLVGAKEYVTIPKVLKAAFSVQAILFAIVTCVCFLGLNTLFASVLRPEEKVLFENSAFVLKVNICVGLMCLFFLLDGCWWTVVGHLTAISDTKFILYMNTLGQWLLYILPTYLLVKYANLGAVGGWIALVTNSLVLFLIFLARSSRKIRQEVLA